MLRTFVLRASSVLALSLALAVPVLASATYTVRPGDTLSAIAQRAHVSVDQIVHLNHLANADVLSQGEVLRLIAPASAPAHKAASKHSPRHASKNLARSHAGGTRVAVANRARTSARKAHRVKHHPAQTGEAQMAQREALWVALHTGYSSPDFSGNPSFAAAQKALALELRLTKTALRYLGVPYSWGGESFSGVDCSGFVQAVFRRNGIDLPRTADAQYEVGRRISSSGLQPGDLVFFETYSVGASHVGIYLGQGQFVHASSSNGVRVDSLSESYYANRFIGARREAI